MFKKILVPLDGSERAEAILPHVEDLATRYDATVLFLQVVEPGVIYTSPYDAYPELNADEVEQRASRVADYLREMEQKFRAKGIDTQKRIEHGPVVPVILEAAANDDVDLIAMASHGRTGLARVFYGSVAAGVLHRIDRPLLLVRAN